MRYLQNIPVLAGIDTPLTCYPGKWADVTADSSVQIICLDPVVSDDTSLSSDEPTHYTGNKNDFEVDVPQLLNGNFKTQSCVDFNTVLHKTDKTLGAHQYGLAENVWFSDTCLNERPDIRNTQFKDFSSTGDLTTGNVNKPKHSWKPILRKSNKTRRYTKKSVSFKASEAETRYYIKCDINTKCDTDSNQAFTEFNQRQAEVEVNNGPSVDREEDLVLKKPIIPVSEVKVAKVVKCKPMVNSAGHAVKRKLAHNNNELSETDDGFPEVVCKIPRYSVQTTNQTDIGPLSKFLMENDRKMLTSTPNMLQKSCPRAIENEIKALPSLNQHTVEVTKGTRSQFRMGTSNLRTPRCQRKLSFNDHVSTNISEVISSIEQQLESADDSPKPIRPRLGLQCKTSKLVDLDTLNINLVCEMKTKISKSNTGMKIKTNGSLQCKSKLKTACVPSPLGKCFKRTIRPSQAPLRQGYRAGTCLETLV